MGSTALEEQMATAINQSMIYEMNLRVQALLLYGIDKEKTAAEMQKELAVIFNDVNTKHKAFRV